MKRRLNDPCEETHVFVQFALGYSLTLLREKKPSTRIRI